MTPTRTDRLWRAFRSLVIGVCCTVAALAMLSEPAAPEGSALRREQQAKAWAVALTAGLVACGLLKGGER